MAWNKIKDINHTMRSNYVDEPTRYWKTELGAWYLKGVFMIHTVGKLYVDSGNSAHYRIDCNVYVQHVFNRIGGHWKGNSGQGLTLSFDGDNIYSDQINLPLRCWDNDSYEDVFVISFDKDFTIRKAGYLDIDIELFYGGAARIGSPNNVPSSLKPFTSVDGFSGTYSNFINYKIPDPYKPASITLNSATEVGRKDTTAYNMNYTITKGTNAISWSAAALYNYDNNNLIDQQKFNRKSGGTFNDTFSLNKSGFSHGSRYKLRARCYDGKNELQSGTKTVYTYQQPKLTGLTLNKTEVGAGNSQPIKFSTSGTNDRRWSSYEDQFYTMLNCTIPDGTSTSGGYKKVANTTGVSSSFTLENATLRNYVPKKYDAQNITAHVIRRNNKANWNSAEKTGTFKVYYRPRIPIVNNNVAYKLNNSGGTAVNKNQIVNNTDALTGIYVSFNYDTTIAKSGYTQGYRIRLYNRDQQVVATYYTTNKNYPIPKSDIPKMQQTWIDVTPYYGNDQSNLASASNAGNYWYYNLGNIELIPFVQLTSSLAKPTITYPTQGSNWINYDFRVCFTLPNDPDYDVVEGTYLYENIELEINNNYYIKLVNSNGTSNGAKLPSNNYVFSCDSNNITHKKNMIMWPNSMTNMPKSNTYNIRVRVKKKYNADSSNNYGWSQWSETRTFYVNIPSYSFIQGNIIRAIDYNNAKNIITRIKNTYAVNGDKIPDNANAGNTIILRSQYYYNNIYKYIVDTKKKVNGFGPIQSGHDLIEFDYSDQILESFTPIQEYVTAEKTADDHGNYMKVIYERSKLLK